MRQKKRSKLRSAPGRALSSGVHREIRKSEDDNVGVESAHKLEEAAETGARLYQHRVIQKQYAKSKPTKSALKKAEETTEQAVRFICRRRRGIGLVLGMGLMLIFMLNAMLSCSMFFQSGAATILAGTYPSEDEDMLAAEAAYAGMEADLQGYLDNYERTHSYDEYHYNLDDIEHDPYVLISLLTAWHQGPWTMEEVESTLGMLFARHYTLTETVETEIRYRTEVDVWIDDEGVIHRETYEVAYDYYICTVTLDNFNLSYLPVYIMGEDQLSMYALYMSTLGNRPDLFGGVLKEYLRYEIPAEALEDEVFAAIITEAEKYLGFPYVWGGSSPKTSFDCSGFVSYVLNQCGWDIGRLGAQGLYNICTPVSRADAKPGDLVFFTGTYDAGVPVSHVGIYAGEDMMIHAGDPISYISFETSYYRNHMYGFGQLP